MPTPAATVITTERLDLRPLTLPVLDAFLDGDRLGASRALTVSIPIRWPKDFDLFELRRAQLADDPGLGPWLLRAICDRKASEMVGYIGFHGAPGQKYLEPWAPGGVELGFTVAPDHRGNGYAREAAEGLMAWAATEHGVAQFVLTIAPDNEPSQHIATAMGFQRVGSHEDEIDGTEDVLVATRS